MSNKQLAMYRAGTVIASALPGVSAYRMGQKLGWLLGRLPDYDGRRAVVASHMGRVLGRPLSREEERRMVADVFANFGRYWAESLRLPTLSHSEVAAGIAMVGFDHVQDRPRRRQRGDRRRAAPRGLGMGGHVPGRGRDASHRGRRAPGAAGTLRMVRPLP